MCKIAELAGRLTQTARARRARRADDMADPSAADESADDPVGPSGMVRSVFTALAFDAFLYCCGRFVVAPYVLRGCSSVPRRLFAASFSLSLALLTLVLVEVLGMLTASARLLCAAPSPGHASLHA